MMRRLLVLGLLLVGGCGNGASDAGAGVLDDAEAYLSDLQEATVDLELSASTDGAGPVGFRMQGPFSFDPDHDLPVLDLTYTRLRGEDEEVVRVVSDGTAVVIEQDAETFEVPEDELDMLRLDRGDTAGLQALNLAEWFESSKLDERGSTTTVSGRLDSAALLRDLNRIVAEVAGEAGLAQLDDDAADRLEKRVRKSSIEITTEGADHHLRTLDAVIDFGTDIPSELAEALGPYAAARLELRVALNSRRGD